ARPPRPPLFPSTTLFRSSPDAEWWRLYADPTLDSLVSQALEHNSDVRIASECIEEAAAVTREVGASRFPELNAQGSGARSSASEDRKSTRLNSSHVKISY